MRTKWTSGARETAVSDQNLGRRLEHAVQLPGPTAPGMRPTGGVTRLTKEARLQFLRSGSVLGQYRSALVRPRVDRQ
jgi:hypothetical protein